MTTDRRYALIIAANQYDDPDLRRLISPAEDAERLERVLKNPAIGEYNVKVLLNETKYNVEEEIEAFFSDRKQDDLLLLYFSCHGIKDEDGQLYYATTKTRRKLLGSTAISSNFVNNMIQRSRSRQKVLILDCCYSGAFARGFISKADKKIHTGEYFHGERGTFVLTASDAMQYSFEGDSLNEEKRQDKIMPSIFTQALLEGLNTGGADRDKDGLVSPEELYDFIYDQVIVKTPSQTPRKWAFGVQGDIVIAKNPNLSGLEVSNKSQDRFQTKKDILPTASVTNTYFKNKGTDSGHNYLTAIKKIYPMKNKIAMIAILTISIISISIYFGLYHSDHKSDSNETSKNSSKTVLSPVNFLTYYNPAYGMKVKYPAEWTKDNVINSLNIKSRDIVSFRSMSPISLPLNISQASVTLGRFNYPVGNSSEIINDLFIKYPKFKSLVKIVESNSTSKLGIYPAHKIELVLANLIRFTQISAVIENKTYYINSMIEESQYPHYLPIIQKLIDSFQIYNITASMHTDFLTYYNPIYGINIQYPDGWLKNEYGSPTSPVATDVVNFDSPETDASHKYQLEFRVSIGNSTSGSTVESYLRDAIRSIHNNSDIVSPQILRYETNASLAGNPAYKLIYNYTYAGDGIVYKAISTGAVISGKVYDLSVLINAKYYSKYLPTVQRMFNSFNVVNLVQYKNSAYGITIQMPSIWIDNSAYRQGYIATLDTPEINSLNNYEAEVRIGIDNSSTNNNLTEYLKNNIHTKINNPQQWRGFQLIGSSVNDTLAGQQAYQLVFNYTYGTDGKGTAIETGTFIGSKVYYILALVTSDNYLPVVQKMIDSFNVIPKTMVRVNQNN